MEQAHLKAVYNKYSTCMLDDKSSSGKQDIRFSYVRCWRFQPCVTLTCKQLMIEQSMNPHLQRQAVLR